MLEYLFGLLEINGQLVGHFCNPVGNLVNLRYCTGDLGYLCGFDINHLGHLLHCRRCLWKAGQEISLLHWPTLGWSDAEASGGRSNFVLDITQLFVDFAFFFFPLSKVVQ